MGNMRLKLCFRKWLRAKVVLESSFSRTLARAAVVSRRCNCSNHIQRLLTGERTRKQRNRSSGGLRDRQPLMDATVSIWAGCLSLLSSQNRVKVCQASFFIHKYSQQAQRVRIEKWVVLTMQRSEKCSAGIFSRNTRSRKINMITSQCHRWSYQKSFHCHHRA